MLLNRLGMQLFFAGVLTLVAGIILSSFVLLENNTQVDVMPHLTVIYLGVISMIAGLALGQAGTEKSSD